MASRLLNKNELIEQCKILQKEIQQYKDKEQEFRSYLELGANARLTCNDSEEVNISDETRKFTFQEILEEFNKLKGAK